MKCLFIIQGEGRGHITQAIRLKEILSDQGHSVTAACIGISPERDTKTYLPAAPAEKVKFFRSPNFIRTENRRGIKITSTILHNLLQTPVYIRSIFLLRRYIHNEEPDIIVNFYDLIGGLAWMFSKRKAEYYAISHHFLFESPQFMHPANFWFQKKLLYWHNKIVSCRSEKNLALSFDQQHAFGKTLIFPPLIRTEVLEGTPELLKFILVYLLNEGLAVDLLSLFNKHKDLEFRLYMQQGIDPGIFPLNVILKRLDYKQFATDLLQCSALITTSGFESVCEAAYLGKPVFLIPTENHYEQHGNMLDAIRARLAMDYRDFDQNYQSKTENKSFREWCGKAEELFLECF